MRLKRLAKDRLSLFGGRGRIVDRRGSGQHHWTRIATDGNKVLAHEFNKVGGK